MPPILEKLLQTVEDADQLLILTHNNPDPDALAAAVAFQHLLALKAGLSCQIAFGGIIGRAENKALARYLDIPFSAQALLAQVATHPLALVDAQPDAGNVISPAAADILIVIDAHTLLPGTSAAAFADVRPHYGATATILVEYFQMGGITLPPSLATALFYGIKTNTMGLSRNTCPADATAYNFLQPKIDVEALGQIEQARVPPQYFRSFDAALRSARLYDELVFSNLGTINYPDLTAEMADLLLRLERARWVVCVGVFEQTLMISIRTGRRRENAAQLAQALVQDRGSAGGHGTIAGGQIPLQDQKIRELSDQLVRRALQTLNISPETAGIPLF
jgi:nanoRNase/pAp phosphatase (c-di-AMP/oligoRNAs hydrolase)